MKLLQKTKTELEKKFKKVVETPTSFGFFQAIHDFIEYIETNPALSGGLSHRIKINRDLNISIKYGHLKQIYQGMEDVSSPTGKDIGHTRYMVVRDLTRIQNKETSENNFFWKKRELFRKLVGEVYARVDSHLSDNN